MKMPQKVRNGNTTWFSNSTTGYLFEENKITNSKRYMHPFVHCSIIYDSQYVGAICQRMDKDLISVKFSCSVVSDSLQPHESQHARPPCPSPTPGVHSDSRSSSQWA